DACDEAVLLEIVRLGEQRLRRLQLRAGGVRARGCGEGLEIRVGGDQHNELASALIGVRGRGDIVPLGAHIVERAQVDDWLRDEHARVEQIEGANDWWNAFG